MNALLRAHELAHAIPPQSDSEVFRELLDSLQSGKAVSLNRLYDLDYNAFELALSAMKDWRLHRYGFGQGH